MIIKKIIRQYIFAGIIFFLAPFLLAETGEDTASADSTEPRYMQRIVWAEDEFALRYEVVIENIIEGEYRSVLREFTASSFIIVSLPEGQYRCRVIPYDYLERAGDGSPWMDFELYPVLDIVTVPVGGIPIKDKNKKSPEEKQKTLDYYLSVQWTPAITVYGEENQFLEKGFSFTSAALRLGIITSKRNFINPGLELTALWRKTGEQHTAAADLDFLAQKWFSNRDIALRFRAGAGISLLPEDSLNIPEQGIHINTGGSFLWLPREHFFLELGLDYAHFFTNDQSGCFLPFFGLGLRF